ncbi:MAG: polysaccharide deacetylase family protein [Pseudohongiella sp.]|nr:polysaccharide deacetylase family protein [Pseudohongiella sp.]
MPALRKLIKTTGASVLNCLAIDKLIGMGNGARRAPLIVCYHRVVRDFVDSSVHSMPSLLISTEMFEKQLDWLAENYDLVSMDEVMQALNGNRKAGKKQLATITFDDGYVDFYWNAFPILKRKGIASCVFVVTNLVGTENLQTHDELYLMLSLCMSPETPLARIAADTQTKRLVQIIGKQPDPYSAARHILSSFSNSEVIQLIELMRDRIHVSAQHLKELRSLSWSMLRTLSVQGVTIGSHTQSHALLPRYEQTLMEKELAASRRRLELELGMPIKYLAYPDGQFDERTAQAAEAAGYEAAVTTCQHTSTKRPNFALPRRLLWEKSCTNRRDEFSPAIMSCLLNGVFQYPDNCAQDHSVS